MTQTNTRQEQIHKFILDEIEKRLEMLGEDKSAVKKIIEGKQSLVDSGIFDSLNFLELLAALEDKFEVEIDLSGYDLEYFVTLEGLILVVNQSENKISDIEKSDNNKQSAKDLPKIVDGISYVELMPEHKLWQELPALFDALYDYLGTMNLFVRPKKNGAELWLKYLENGLGKTQVVIGAIDDDKLVGYFHGILKILPVYLEGGMVGELLSMYVLKEYQKRKIAHRMYERVYQWLIEQNITSVEARVMTENNLGINYWLERGYQKELLQFRKIILDSAR